MKKIKTFNKLLSSLTLLTPLVGIGFNSEYQNTQKIITENNSSLNNYFSTNAAPVQMGDIYVNLDETGKIIKSYASGEGSLVISSEITKIEVNSFSQNKNITAIDLSQATSLTSIGYYAFENCTNMTGSLILPDSLIYIGEKAFNGCTALTIDLVIPSSVKSIGNNSFTGINITSLDISQARSLTTIGNSAFSSCVNITGDITIPSSVTSIGDSAFYRTGITSLNLSNATSLADIGPNAFYFAQT